MRTILGVLWEALKQLWDAMFTLVLMNMLTVLLAVPVITFPPALAGLWYVANQVVHERSAEWSDYLLGFRRYFLRSWGLALIDTLAIVIVLANIWFYAPAVSPFNISQTASVWIRGFFVVVGFIWWCYQLYPMAVLLEQEEPRIWWALRNSAILLIANPGFSIVLGVLSLAVIVLSLRFPPLLLLLTLSLLAVVYNKVVVHLLKPFRERARAQKESGQDVPGGSGEGQADNANETG